MKRSTFVHGDTFVVVQSIGIVEIIGSGLYVYTKNDFDKNTNNYMCLDYENDLKAKEAYEKLKNMINEAYDRD